MYVETDGGKSVQCGDGDAEQKPLLCWLAEALRPHFSYWRREEAPNGGRQRKNRLLRRPDRQGDIARRYSRRRLELNLLELSACDHDRCEIGQRQGGTVWILVLESNAELSVIEVGVSGLVDAVSLGIEEEPGFFLEPRRRWHFSPLLAGHTAPLRPQAIDIGVMQAENRVERRGRRRCHSPQGIHLYLVAVLVPRCRTTGNDAADDAVDVIVRVTFQQAPRARVRIRDTTG